MGGIFGGGGSLCQGWHIPGLPASPAPNAHHSFLPWLLGQGRGIELHEDGGGVAEVMPSLLLLADGTQLPYDECLWCTQAGAAGWVADSGLPTDEGAGAGVACFYCQEPYWCLSETC